MPVQSPWTLDIETIIGVAITLLAVLAVQVATRLRDRRRKRSNRHDRGDRSLRLDGGLYWKDDRNGGAVGTHGVRKRLGRSKNHLKAIPDAFRTPLEQDPAGAPADE